jgi:integrase/recombinase XerD
VKTNNRNSDGIIGILLHEYLGSFRALKYSEKSIEIYSRALQDFSAFLDAEELKEIRNLEESHLVRYRLQLIERNFKPASIEIYLRAVKRFLGHLEERQHIFFNPAEKLMTKQAERPLLPVPTEEDILRLLQQPDLNTVIGIRDRALLETAYGTAARLGELAAMRLESLNLGERTVRLFGKGSRERMVPLGRGAVEWLTQYIEKARPELLKGNRTDALWVSTKQEELGYQAISVIIRGYGKKAGLSIGINPHSLRRACVTHMLRNGADPISIQQLLGHASLGTLSQYLRVSITEVKAMHEKTRPGH